MYNKTIPGNFYGFILGVFALGFFTTAKWYKPKFVFARVLTDPYRLWAVAFDGQARGYGVLPSYTKTQIAEGLADLCIDEQVTLLDMLKVDSNQVVDSSVIIKAQHYLEGKIKVKPRVAPTQQRLNLDGLIKNPDVPFPRRQPSESTKMSRYNLHVKRYGYPPPVQTHKPTPPVLESRPGDVTAPKEVQQVLDGAGTATTADVAMLAKALKVKVD